MVNSEVKAIFLNIIRQTLYLSEKIYSEIYDTAENHRKKLKVNNNDENTANISSERAVDMAFAESCGDSIFYGKKIIEPHNRIVY